jgi:D-alanyl-D-alanine carboxypeptidase/D-alanyl-D-alanine-endopeptidase (penicillin-binding protein 4)
MTAAIGPYLSRTRSMTRSLSLLFALLLTAPVGGLRAQDGGRSAVVPLNEGLVAIAGPLDPSVATLRTDLAGILGTIAADDARFSILVVSLDRGDTLFAVAPDLPLAPASNMKLYTTAAALHYLGPGFRYSTYLSIDGEVRDGILQGDVILRGTGDPSLSERMLGSGAAPFGEMIDSLRALGIREVTGDVIGDGSWFDAEWLAPDWEMDDRLTWYAAPVGGLGFAENMVRVRVAPGRAAGDPARITTSPATVGLALRNEVRTAGSGRTRVRFEHAADGILVTGTVLRGRPGTERVLPVVDPANYAAAGLRAAMEGRGIAVHGRTRAGVARGGRPRIIAEHLSPPLAELVSVTNHVSHNLFAEALLKTIGRVVAGEGSYRAGAGVVERFVAGVTDAAPGALRVVDGSGLSRPNRTAAGATVALLEYAARSDLAGSFIPSLPQAGTADGLRRMYDTPAAGNLRAKTGTIREVSALSGYVTAADGERLAFSIISNGLRAGWRAKSLEDRVAVRLASFSR